MLRTLPLSTLLLCSGLALAAPVALEHPVQAVVGDASTMVAVGAEGGVVLDLASGSWRPIDLKATAAVLVRDAGTPYLAVCVPDEGLSLLSWPARIPVAQVEEPCEALAGDGSTLVSAGSEVVVYRVAGGALAEIRREEAPGRPLTIAAGSDLVVMAKPGEAGMTESSAFGLTPLDTKGLVGGVAMRDGLWIWSLPEEDLVRGQLGLELLAARGPTNLLVQDLDGDGVEDILVQHSDRVGIIRDDAEVLLPWRGEVWAVGLDGRSCPSVWVAGGGELREFPGECAGAASSPARAPVAEAPPEPSFAAPEAILLDGRTIPEVRVRVGESVDTRVKDTAARHMVYAARGGPVGMVVYPDGRLTYTPRAGQEGTYAVSVRMTLGMLRRSASFRMIVEPSSEVRPDEGDAGGGVDSGAALEPRLRPKNRGTIAQCVAELGLGVAASAVRLTWEFAGQTVAVYGSPALAATCEGPGKWRWFMRGETAPTLAYVPVGGGDSARGNPHALGAAVGLAYGWDSGSVGAYVGAGIVYSGVGLRTVWMPLSMRGGNTHGPVLDALLYLPSLPAGAVRVGWALQL